MRIAREPRLSGIVQVQGTVTLGREYQSPFVQQLLAASHTCLRGECGIDTWIVLVRSEATATQFFVDFPDPLALRQIHSKFMYLFRKFFFPSDLVTASCRDSSTLAIAV